ncbi:hypothetical protein FG386_000959 [Cryptosporidium ryanae]|uniref:uncharacterized protein n=1 Tax=Cryptosporidium ryanae TaxID=515981 RepID=UPI00351A043C|nr:hypothetical protein FG386_000959 [Cryptosporidium ryanae]
MNMDAYKGIDIENNESKIEETVNGINVSRKILDLKSILDLIEEAKKSSFERLDKTVDRIEENYETNVKKYEKGFIDLDYKMFDIDIPEMRVYPTEDEINKRIIHFLSGFVDYNMGINNKTKNPVECDDTENIDKSNVNDKCVSPAPKRTRGEEEESSFVASIIRLWENKTPKISSIWRKNKNVKDDKLELRSLGISKIESLNIVSTDKTRVSQVENREEVKRIIGDNNDKNKVKLEKYMSIDDHENNVKTNDESEMNSELSELSPKTKNIEFSVEKEHKAKDSISISLSPTQSPPLLALTPSTPVPIIQNAKASITSAERGTCSLETVKTIRNNPTPTCSSMSLMENSNIETLGNERKTFCDNNNENGGSDINKNETDNDKDESESKGNSVSMEDSPLAPKPIRRLTGDKDKGIKKMSNNKEDKANECEQTPILKGGNLEGTPKEMSVRGNKVDSRMDDDGTNDGKTDFARPERLSCIKRSGLRSILNHSANRVLKENQVGSGPGPGSASGSRSFHLVKTPTGKYGLCKYGIEGKDKQQKLGLGESPCRRYHKRLKLLPPVNPEECYELTDSEDDDTNNQIGVNGQKVNKTQKRIPLWARSMNWIPKIKEQRNVDPFSIFGDSCMFMDLEDVFQRPLYISTVARDNRIKSWQNDRVTSLNWSEDSLTSDELRKYKLKMNYYIDKSSEVYVTEPCFTPSPNPMVNGAWNHINKQRINSGGTTVIRKALNLSVHRLNCSSSQKPRSQNNSCSLDYNSENNNISNVHQNNDLSIANNRTNFKVDDATYSKLNGNANPQTNGSSLSCIKSLR